MKVGDVVCDTDTCKVGLVTRAYSDHDDNYAIVLYDYGEIMYVNEQFRSLTKVTE